MSKIKRDCYEKMRAMQVAYKIGDEEIMEKLMRPCKVRDSGATEIILIEFTESREVIAVNLATNTIEREVKFTEEIRLKANIIAGAFAGADMSQLAAMEKALGGIGIGLNVKKQLPTNPKAGVYNFKFLYKGMPENIINVFFDVYDADPCQKFSCYFS